jgi:hypothetical protein
MPSRSTTIRETAFLVAAISLLAMASVGCGPKKVVAAVPVLAPPSPDVHPMTIAPDTDASPPLDATAVEPPTVPTTTDAPSVDLPLAKAAPPPRRAPSAPAATEANEADNAAHPPAPRIAPQLSRGDQQAYQHRIDDDSSVAQKNLQSSSGRQLNAAQQDLVDKIRGFLDQSREAGKEGDWARSENLAQKARLLSVELINSL